MPRTAVVKLVSLKNGLVNLPMSVYGPLVEHGTTPQTLGVELSLLRKPASSGKKERVRLLVGWTGLASQVAAWQGSSVKESIELDPQVASEVGFRDGDEVNIDLHRGLPVAKAVNVEPISADDWEILETNAEYVEQNLLSQVRAVHVGQTISVWVLGKTRVRFLVTSLDPPPSPSSSSVGALLSTDSEVIVAPKSRAAASDAKAKHEVLDPSTATKEGKKRSTEGQRAALAAKKLFLRILPSDVDVAPLHDLGEGPSAGADAEWPTYLHPRDFRLLTAAYPTSLCTMTLVARPNAPAKPAASAQPDPKASSKDAAITKGKARAATVTGRDQFVKVGIKARLKSEAEVPIGTIWLPEGTRKGCKLGPCDYELVRFLPWKGKPDSPAPNEIVEPEPDELEPRQNLAGIDDLLRKTFEQVRYGLASSAVRGDLRTGNVPGHLVCGAPGSGKTSFAKAIARHASKDPKTLLHCRYVDCSKHVDDRLPTMKANLRDWFDGACWHSPSLLVLDNIDKMLPAEVEHIDSFRFRHLTEDFLAAAVPAIEQYPVVLLATSASNSSLHPLLMTCHLFGETVKLKPPDKNARKAIVNALAQAKAAASDLQIDELNATTVATSTEGYLPTDLRDLVDRAVHQAAIRSAGDLSPVRLTGADFESAQKGFVPLSLKDVKLQKSEVQWADVGGLKETRRVLRETLEWPTKYAAIFRSCPLRLRSGLLLYGFPGCGKTLLASAVAKECGLNFVSVKGPELLNKYIGASEKSVRDLFERASAAKPCVLFFDEFDSIAPKRGHDSTGVTDRVVNQLLTQMDGAEGLEGVYVLAATSRPDLIDPALLRPGRLDKSLLCGMPDADERVEILQASARKLPLDASVDFSDFADRTEGFTGADLQALVYAAHLEVVHEGLDVEKQEGKTNGVVDGEGEGKLEWFEVDAQGGLPNGKAVRSRAEEEAVRKRLEVIVGTLNGGADRKAASGTPRTNPRDKPRIQPRHLRSALDTVRPSVPKEELARLGRIYAKFVDARSADGLPSGEASVEIGGRASLM